MPEYAKNQSAGFKNSIERVAIVGVRIAPIVSHTQQLTDPLGRRHGWIQPRRCSPQNRKTHSYGALARR